MLLSGIYSVPNDNTRVDVCRDVKSREFFSRYEKFFFRDSTRILDHVMMMSHPAE